MVLVVVSVENGVGRDQVEGGGAQVEMGVVVRCAGRLNCRCIQQSTRNNSLTHMHVCTQSYMHAHTQVHHHKPVSSIA